MAKIRILNSESELRRIANRNLKYNLAFDQKEFYLDDGADIYYNRDSFTNVRERRNFMKKNYDFFRDNFLDKNKKVVIVSLGCGNSDREYYLLNRAYKEGYDVEYFGVDSSIKMIDISSERFKNAGFRHEFIYADFSDEKFRYEINRLIDSDSKKVFALIGATLGNVPQNYIANTLKNILNKGDMLWLDVIGKVGLDNISANHFFKKFLNMINKPEEIKFLKYPIKEKNIPLDNGKFGLTMIREKPMDNLFFTFSFIINKKTEFKINNDEVLLLENDKIDLITARVYEYKSLKKFFEERNFKSTSFCETDNILQIAFRKK